MEHHGLRLRSDGTIDTDYYVNRARARRQSERLIDETALDTKRRIAPDSLAQCFGAFDPRDDAVSRLIRSIHRLGRAALAGR